MSGALDDVVVLELATGVAGGYTGRLLSDLGAQVIKVEPPDGDPLRQEPPIVGSESAFFNWMAAGKRSVQLSLDDSRLDGLMAHADIVIHSERGAAADELDRRARAANGGAVVLSLTPWGRSGGRSTWQATELVEYATGGYHYFCGDPEREPLALQGHQAGYHAGAHASFGALAAMWHARGTGEGQCIELSHQEATLNDHAWLVTMWTHTGQVQRRAGSMFAPCADGFVYLFTLVPYPNLFALIERFDLLEDEELQVPATWQERFPEVFEAFCEWTKDRTKQEIYHAAQELRIAVSPVNTMADLPASPQLAAREWFREIEADGRRFTAPGFAFHPAVTPCERPATAPALGEHTDEVLGDGFAWANASAGRQQAPARRGDGKGPLAGVRVIEATANWAGPARRPPARRRRRRGHQGRAPDQAGDPRAHVHRRRRLAEPLPPAPGNFNKHNRNQKDRPASIMEAWRQAGVPRPGGGRRRLTLENDAARVASAQLGLAFDTLVQHNPRIVTRPMSGYSAARRAAAHHPPDRRAISKPPADSADVVGYGPGRILRHWHVLRRPGHRQPRRRRHHGRAPLRPPHRPGPVDRHGAARIRHPLLRPALPPVRHQRRTAGAARQPLPHHGPTGPLSNSRDRLLACPQRPR
ncbi:MAG: CoA transferase [Dehalococcoidia bacterium]|nr:CoA transferase [Dehalococcoidia bacterium]